MNNVQIRVVETEEELLEKYKDIKEVPLINVLHRDLLIKCLEIKAAMLVGSINGEDVGVAIVEKQNTNMSILAVNAKNSAGKLMAAFYSWAKSIGITRVTMMSTFDRKIYEKLFEVKHLTSIYEKDLTKWQQQ